MRPVCRPAASSRSTPQTGSVCPCGALHSGRQGCALRAQILTRSPSGLRLPVWPLTPSAPQLPSLELAERCAASHGRARARRHFSQDRVLTWMVRPGHPGRRRRRRGGRKQLLRRDDPCAVRRRLCRRSAQQLTGAGGLVSLTKSATKPPPLRTLARVRRDVRQGAGGVSSRRLRCLSRAGSHTAVEPPYRRRQGGLAHITYLQEASRRVRQCLDLSALSAISATDFFTGHDRPLHWKIHT